MVALTAYKTAFVSFCLAQGDKEDKGQYCPKAKRPYSQKLQMTSQYSPSYWNPEKGEFRNTVNFCLSWNSNN